MVVVDLSEEIVLSTMAEVIFEELRNNDHVETAVVPQWNPVPGHPGVQGAVISEDLRNNDHVETTVVPQWNPVPGHPGVQGAALHPSIEIVEQPGWQRFRYLSELSDGRNAGRIRGKNSTPKENVAGEETRVTYPTIKINGYRGRVVVVVSCVTKDYPHKAHPHKLVGKEGCKRGICTVEVNNDSMTASFPNLGIQCIKRKDMVAALEEREKIKVDPFRMGFAHKNQVNTIDLNVVRFSFQAFFRTNQWVTIPPVVSEPIYDKKAMSNLQICRICPPSASVRGNTEVILTCEKVTRDDIEVWIYEKNDAGEMVWEEKTEFQPQDVHHQYAIAFKLPQYKSLEVENPVKAWIELRKPSDQTASLPRPFQLIPLDPGDLRRKRARQQSTDSKLSDSSFHTGGRTTPGTTIGGIPILTIKREPEFSPVYNPGYPNVQSPSLYAPSTSRSPSVYAPSTSRTPSPGMDFHPSPGSQNYGMPPSSHMMDGVMSEQPSAVMNETLNASLHTSNLHLAGVQMYTNPVTQNHFNANATLNNLGGMNNPQFPDYTPLSRVTGQNVYNIDSQNGNYTDLDTPTQGVENSISSLPESISNINLSDYIPNRMTDSSNSMMDSFSKYLNSTIQDLPDVDNNN